jgi:hypothetical protein
MASSNVEQRLLPIWVSPKCVTYTEAQEFCVQQYALKGPKLITEVKKHLEDLPDNPQVLQLINTKAIELACFNIEWNDFSQDVFESILFPKSRSGRTKTLIDSFNKTLRRLSNK